MLPERCAARLVISIFALLVATNAGKAQTTYVVHDLGTFGGNQSNAWALNNRGQVAGSSQTADGLTHAFLTGPNGMGIQDLGTLGGTSSFAWGVNDSGQVTGYSQTQAFPGKPQVAFISEPNGGALRLLENLGGPNTRAAGINSAGQVVGYADTAEGGPFVIHAIVTKRNGEGIDDLGTLGGTNSRAYAINEPGQVTGYAYPPGNTDGHAFLSGPGGGALRDLGTLGGTFSVGYAVNSLGQVTGYSPTLPGNIPSHAFVSAPNGGALTDLGCLGGTLAVGYGINDHGVVVGASSTGNDGTQHAFIYTPGRWMEDLNEMIDWTSGFTITGAEAINNLGQIAAIGRNGAGQIRALFLNPMFLDAFTKGAEAWKYRDWVVVFVQGFAHHTYQLQRSPSLDPATANWQNFGHAQVPSSDRHLDFSMPDTTDEKMFYRVVLTP